MDKDQMAHEARWVAQHITDGRLDLALAKLALLEGELCKAILDREAQSHKGRMSVDREGKL